MFPGLYVILFTNCPNFWIPVEPVFATLSAMLPTAPIALEIPEDAAFRADVRSPLCLTWFVAYIVCFTAPERADADVAATLDIADIAPPSTFPACPTMLPRAEKDDLSPPFRTPPSMDVVFDVADPTA